MAFSQAVVDQPENQSSGFFVGNWKNTPITALKGKEKSETVSGFKAYEGRTQIQGHGDIQYSSASWSKEAPAAESGIP